MAAFSRRFLSHGSAWKGIPQSAQKCIRWRPTVRDWHEWKSEIERPPVRVDFAGVANELESTGDDEFLSGRDQQFGALAAD